MALLPPPSNIVGTDLTNTFDVLVGTGAAQKRFTVHHDIVTQRSPFFRAVRSARWTSDPSKPVDLQEHDPETFLLYMQCIYFDRIYLPTTQTIEYMRLDVAPLDTVDGQHDALVKLYILANKLGDIPTCNQTIDKIIHTSVAHQSVPDAQATSFAYASTLSSSPLRRLLADLYLHDHKPFQRDDYPSEFLQDVLVGVHEARARHFNSHLPGRHATERNSLLLVEWALEMMASYCAYHEHDEEHPRCVGHDAYAFA